MVCFENSHLISACVLLGCVPVLRRYGCCYRWSCMVCQSVGWLIFHDCEPCKNGWTDRYAVWDVDLGGPTAHVFDGVQIACMKALKGQFWGLKGAGPGHGCTCPVVDILKATQEGAELIWCRCSLGCTTWEVHIGATWRIRLNRSCAAMMPPYVKLLWPLVNLTVYVGSHDVMIYTRWKCLKNY